MKGSYIRGGKQYQDGPRGRVGMLQNDALGWTLSQNALILPCRLVNRLQQICSALGDGIGSEDILLWNKLPTIVVVGGQVMDPPLI